MVKGNANVLTDHKAPLDRDLLQTENLELGHQNQSW